MSIVIFALAVAWQTPSVWVLLKLSALSLLIVAALLALGELKQGDVAFIASLFKCEARVGE